MSNECGQIVLRDGPMDHPVETEMVETLEIILVLDVGDRDESSPLRGVGAAGSISPLLGSTIKFDKHEVEPSSPKEKLGTDRVPDKLELVTESVCAQDPLHDSRSLWV